MSYLSKRVLSAMRDELEKIAMAKLVDNYVCDIVKLAYTPRAVQRRVPVKASVPEVKPKPATPNTPAVKAVKAKPAVYHQGGRAFDMPHKPMNYGVGSRATAMTRGIKKLYLKRKATALARQSRYENPATPRPRHVPGSGESLMAQARRRNPQIANAGGGMGAMFPGSRRVTTSGPLIGSRRTGPGQWGTVQGADRSHTRLNPGRTMSYMASRALYGAPARGPGNIPKPAPNQFKTFMQPSVPKPVTALPKVTTAKPYKPPPTPGAPRVKVPNLLNRPRTGLLPFSPTGQGNLFRTTF